MVESIDNFRQNIDIDQNRDFDTELAHAGALTVRAGDINDAQAERRLGGADRTVGRDESGNITVTTQTKDGETKVTTFGDDTTIFDDGTTIGSSVTVTTDSDGNVTQSSRFTGTSDELGRPESGTLTIDDADGNKTKFDGDWRYTEDGTTTFEGEALWNKGNHTIRWEGTWENGQQVNGLRTESIDGAPAMTTRVQDGVGMETLPASPALQQEMDDFADTNRPR